MWRAYSSIIPTSTSRNDNCPPAAAVVVVWIVSGDLEARSRLDELRGEVDLGPPRFPRLGDDLGVDDRPVEVAVTVGVGAEQARHVLPRHQHSEGRPFALGQVPDQPEQGHGRRLDGPARHGLGVQIGALHLQREALAAQRLYERGALVAERWSVLTWVVVDGLPSAVNMSARREVAISRSSAIRTAADERVLDDIAFVCRRRAGGPGLSRSRGG